MLPWGLLTSSSTNSAESIEDKTQARIHLNCCTIEVSEVLKEGVELSFFLLAFINSSRDYNPTVEEFTASIALRISLAQPNLTQSSSLNKRSCLIWQLNLGKRPLTFDFSVRLVLVR